MRIVWVCNIKLPIIYKRLQETNTINSGGWLEQFSERLLLEPDVDLHVVYPMSQKKCETGKMGNLYYYGICFEEKVMCSGKLKEKPYVTIFEEILRDVNPDIIHIHGTEFQHSYFMTQAAKNVGMTNRVLTSIQGLVTYCAKQYEFRLPARVKYGKTVREFLLRRGVHVGQKEFKRRAYYEELAIMNSYLVLGRTNWDRGCISLLNPNAHYVKCNETLRSVFYDNKWDYTLCEPYTIFVSQASYPIKGFHLLLEALPLVKKRFPDIKVKVAGANIFSKGFIKGSVYGLYIRHLIEKYNLTDNILFLGTQDADEMKNNMLKSNVFVSTSVLENSPNSLGEAMIMGVPCIASDVGGVSSMMIHNEEGYVYPLNEDYMLAHYIMDIFENPEKATRFGEKAQKHARITHDVNVNYENLRTIYKSVIEASCEEKCVL